MPLRVLLNDLVCRSVVCHTATTTAERIDILVRLIAAARGEAVSSFLDLGYGGGILGAPSCAAGPRLAAFPSISPRPCSSQRGKSSPYGERVTFAVAGYGDSGYEDEVIETEMPAGSTCSLPGGFCLAPIWRVMTNLAGK